MSSNSGPKPEQLTTSENRPPKEGRALLDTTVQLDRRKTQSRKQKLELLLAGYEWRFSTAISLVEFKATVIQECITIHNQLRRKGARFTWVQDALLEKQGQQISLRAHIFHNILQISASSFNTTEEQDQRLAEKARLLLENIIPRLYDWFARESVDVVLNDRLECDRAKEPPRKKTAAFEVNLPECKRGKNKSCHVEQVIREEGAELMQKLHPHLEASEQLQKAVKVFDTVLNSPKTELSHSDCRRAGDCLITLEGKGKATHALSSNAREWEPLSQILGYEFIRISYPEEKTV